MRSCRLVELVALVAASGCAQNNSPTPLSPPPAAAACPSTPGASAPQVSAAPVTSAQPIVRGAVLRDRPYSVEVPSGNDPATPAPVIVLLHGFGSNAFEQEEYFKLGHVAAAHGALLVLADGTRNPSGWSYWNATDACCDIFHQGGPDDVAYLDAVLDDLAGRFSVDSKRVWLIGHSNGAFMAYRYACERAQRVAAVASLAGASWLDPARCAPTAPVAVLEIHGDADPACKYSGGNLGDRDLLPAWKKMGVELPKEGIHMASYPGARATVQAWAKYDGCDEAPDTSSPRVDLDAKLPGAETKVERWQHCKGAGVELWTIHGGGHAPDLAPGFADAVYAFLAAHPKP